MLHPAYDLSFYEFDDVNDVNSYGVLLCDFVHGKPPMKPLYMGIGWYWYYHGIRNGVETLHLPTTLGWDSRFVDGYPYITTIRTTEEERKAREPIFRERIKPFIENFDGVWNPIKADLLKTYQEARESRGLKEWQDIKKLSNAELLSFFLDFTYIINRKEGEAHFLMLMASYYISGLFQKLWYDIFALEPSIDPVYNKLMAGFDNQAIKVVREIWALGRRAVELGLQDAFKAEEPSEILNTLANSELGAQWLKEYNSFLAEHGWRCDRMHAYDTPAWIEDPSQGIKEIRMIMNFEVFPVDAGRERVLKERIKITQEVLDRVPEGQRAAFEVLMKAAQKSGYWSEDHTYYCDLYIGAIGRWIVTEFGRRFAEAGCIDDPEDIHFLHPNDIRKAAVPMGRVNLRPYLEPRKQAWQKNLTTEPAPFYGDITQAQDVLKSDPTLSVSTQVPIVREELKADLYGAAAAPGYIEGIARVIMSADKLSEIKAGEILVAPGTSTAWVIAFGIIKGLITDGGGTLSHPVIMARESGIPCVAGCVEATAKIKTGQKVRLDGDRGVVYILS
ncbi:MAG: PEP-utilizing enzyme [Desulfotomaculaceae bacterium]